MNNSLYSEEERELNLETLGKNCLVMNNALNFLHATFLEFTKISLDT